MEMQWFFDIIHDLIEGWGYITTSFIDRGDPDAADWTQVTLTTNDAWHDLDLSAIVPVDAKAVLFTLQAQDDTVNSYFQIRTNGNVNTWNRSGIRTQVAVVFIDNEIVVPVDSTRIVEYRGSNVDWNRIYLTVKGWWV